MDIPVLFTEYNKHFSGQQLFLLSSSSDFCRVGATIVFELCISHRVWYLRGFGVLGTDSDRQSYTNHFSTCDLLNLSFGSPLGLSSLVLWVRIVGASVHLIADPVLLQPYLQELLPLLEVGSVVCRWESLQR